MQNSPELSDYYYARKKALRKKRISLKSIAEELGIRPANVTLNIQGNPRARNARIERLVARRIGKPLRVVYPEWYK